jgi:isoquinoline 1-oxidoreductase alpha subunit
VPTHTFTVNGSRVSVDCPDDVRLLWVLRDLLGIHGPKYGCGLEVCRACTSHINGEAFNPCAVPVGQVKSTDDIVTIEGLADSVGRDLHPMQEAWLKHDVAQCGYCQPGQIMAAVALVKDIEAKGGQITPEELDQIRNVCRCGTYFRIREAIIDGAAAMKAAHL